MGRTKSIDEMAKTDAAYRNYINDIEAKLEEKSKKYDDDMEKKLNDYYTNNKYTKIDFLSGKSADFMQQSDWSMSNVKLIIDAIVKSVFGDSTAPSGVTIVKAEEVGKAISEMENMELYIAGKCFEVLSGIVESFGATSSLEFNSSYKDEPLGNGLHLFATVVCDSYKSTDFFQNQEIYQYLYLYQVKYSLEEAQTIVKIGLTKLYSDQIATFEGKLEGYLKKLDDGSIEPEAYETFNEIYAKLIDAAKKKLEELKSAGIE